jgi:hypothetical protein
MKNLALWVIGGQPVLLRKRQQEIGNLITTRPRNSCDQALVVIVETSRPGRLMHILLGDVGVKRDNIRKESINFTRSLGRDTGQTVRQS